MAFEITNINMQTKNEGDLKDVAYFANFTTKKGEKTKMYCVDLPPPNPNDFIPYDQITETEKESFIRAKMGTGYTMTEAEFEAELDAMP